jgi:hypothetical protein
LCPCDGFAKSSITALWRILRLWGVPIGSPDSLVFPSLEFGTFYLAIPPVTFCDLITLCSRNISIFFKTAMEKAKNEV